ncbi:Lrp/AsnC family transcriptional regulator [Candidatus Bathyarchaeota archaeon]|nr:Lrp/AsnC family transcriptional regulator [Candidatus Bathyarchaeota archaeon]
MFTIKEKSEKTNRQLFNHRRNKKIVQYSHYKVDDIDHKIIRLLQEDSRKSFNKIAEKLGIAVGTAYNRVKSLEEKGILKGYTIILDPNKLGFNLTALILIEAEGRYLPEVEKELSRLDEVISIYDITGDYDIAVVARFKNRTTLNNFIKSTLKMPHVTRTVTNVVLNVVKEDFRVKV